MRTSRSGFTIVELLIVIVVIAILAAITIAAYTGIQQRARDAERVSDMNNIKKSLELFHAEKGYYPNSAQMANATYRRDILNIPDDTIRAPGLNYSIAYCWSSNPNQYCYVADRRPNPPGGNCTGTGSPPYDITEQCQTYTLSYRTDQDPNTIIRVYSTNQ